jgi:hypothetical protein
MTDKKPIETPVEETEIQKLLIVPPNPAEAHMKLDPF